MTRLLENHFLFGSIRALGRSRLWKLAAWTIVPSAFRCGLPSFRMLSCFTFFAVR